MSENAAPLPCPFCGIEPSVYEIKPHKHVIATFMPDHEGSWWVECCVCDVHIGRRTQDEVIEAWNRRAPK